MLEYILHNYRSGCIQCVYMYMYILLQGSFIQQHIHNNTFLFHMCIIRTHGVTISGRLNAFWYVIVVRWRRVVYGIPEWRCFNRTRGRSPSVLL